nr:suppressor of fused domain protein [uncultured Anaerostipes sp.]
MGLFDKFKKKEKTKENNNEETNVQGWDAITNECERVYPNQKNPKHYGTLINWKFGGNDPLEGISIYDGGDYWHFVTFGLSELYEKETENNDISGYGMEFTFKLKKDNYKNEEAEIKCICGILQSIARITFTKGEVFHAYEYLYTGQTQGIDTEMKSNITGFITIPDNRLNPINTPNGKVDFVEFIGATDSELIALKNKELDVKSLYEKIGSDITNYNRESVI